MTDLDTIVELAEPEPAGPPGATRGRAQRTMTAVSVFLSAGLLAALAVTVAGEQGQPANTSTAGAGNAALPSDEVPALGVEPTSQPLGQLTLTRGVIGAEAQDAPTDLPGGGGSGEAGSGRSAAGAGEDITAEKLTDPEGNSYTVAQSGGDMGVPAPLEPGGVTQLFLVDGDSSYTVSLVYMAQDEADELVANMLDAGGTEVSGTGRTYVVGQSTISTGEGTPTWTSLVFFLDGIGSVQINGTGLAVADLVSVAEGIDG